MFKKILEVTEVTLEIQKTNPPTLVINAKGNVNSGGWKNGQLVPYIYITPPADGIYEFDFLAEAPSGPSTSAIEEIKTQYSWNDFPADLKGVKVYSSSNYLVALTEDGKQGRNSSKSGSFDVVSEDELAKLKKESHPFFITNAFILENDLIVSVEHSGGCKEHNFRLVWDGSVIKTMPPKYNLTIIHDNNGDHCKAIIRDELQFDLTQHINETATILLDGYQTPLTFTRI